MQVSVQFLVFHARQDRRNEPIGKSIGNSGSGFAEVGRENDYEIEHTPDAEFAFWQSQLDLSYKYWGDRQAKDGAENEPPMDRIDAQFAAVMTELVTIKRLVRQLLHG